jgi:hypothetical protein
MTNEPEQNEELSEEKTFAEQVEESLSFIVNMMNEGKADPKEVYPSNRYHGD